MTWQVRAFVDNPWNAFGQIQFRPAAPKKKSSPPPAPRKLVFPSFDRPRRIPRGRGVAADSTDTVRPVRGRIGVIEVGVSRAEADAEIKRMLEHDPRFWREYLWL